MTDTTRTDTKTDNKSNGAKADAKPAAALTDTRFQIAADVFSRLQRGFDSDEAALARHAFRAADAFIAQYHAGK